jgi:hypothetical protein
MRNLCPYYCSLHHSHIHHKSIEYVKHVTELTRVSGLLGRGRKIGVLVLRRNNHAFETPEA